MLLKQKSRLFLPGFFYRYLLISVLTKASRAISKVVAKIKEACKCI